MLLAVILLFARASCIGLQGTWMSKSQTVTTGKDFYDPLDELIRIPSLPGMAYSFDDNGNWELSIYFVQANAINPECPTATILWQHGKFTKHGDGSLTLYPYPSDGRKIFSDPCNNDESWYMRYQAEEKIDHFVIEYDHYNGKYKLQLYNWDGSKKQPLWLEYNPPNMLPTEPINPTDAKQKESLSKINQRIKRSIENRFTHDLRRQWVYDTITYHVLSISTLTVVLITFVFLVQRIKRTTR